MRIKEQYLPAEKCSIVVSVSGVHEAGGLIRTSGQSGADVENGIFSDG